MTFLVVLLGVCRAQCGARQVFRWQRWPHPSQWRPLWTWPWMPFRQAQPGLGFSSFRYLLVVQKGNNTEYSEYRSCSCFLVYLGRGWVWSSQFLSHGHLGKTIWAVTHIFFGKTNPTTCQLELRLRLGSCCHYMALHKAEFVVVSILNSAFTMSAPLRVIQELLRRCLEWQQHGGSLRQFSLLVPWTAKGSVILWTL